MTATQKRSRVLATMLALTIASAVAACTPSGGADPSPTVSSSAGASSSPVTPTPSVSAPDTSTPSTAPVPAATCETVLTPEEYASLAEDNLRLRDQPQPFDDVMIAMLDEGALGCQWAGQGDVMVWFAQQPLSESEWQTRRAELVAQGYSQSNDPFTGTLRGPDDADPNFIPSVHYADGTLYYVSYSTFLQSVLALQ